VAALAAGFGGAGVFGLGGAARAASGPSSLTFNEIAHGETESHVVADGYEAQTLIRWGDPVEPGAPAFDPLKQTAAAQAKQWGYNNDYLAFMPLPRGSSSADHGLLCANFEYTDHYLMFPGIQQGDAAKLSREQVDIELAAHGFAVVEIRRDNATNRWSYLKDSPYNRRVSMLTTECRMSGPAAGHPRLRTSADPTGTRVIGTLNNCAGGKTPWGTVLSAEENFHQYFGGDAKKTAEPARLERYGVAAKPAYSWHLHHDRFDVGKEPNEPNRFGWMVEIDPYDPRSVPIKRTALGRFKHEAATCVVNPDGRLVVYSGDDERFEYVYRFVSLGKVDPADRAANRDLLDEGTLSVARFAADGTVTWLPLVWGEGPLTAANGFASQADVLIDVRRAADLLGATPMDRPEDVEASPKTGAVYVALTNNPTRTAEKVDAANPRGPNLHGHIIEMLPPGTAAADRDHAAATFRWDIFLLGGDPAKPDENARYHPETTADGWLSCPDNIAFDRQGRIWVATDGAPKFGIADGAWAADTDGPGRALCRHFYRTPIGSELCGPEFNSDDTAFFAAVQHPGDSKGSTFDQPSTRWPDFQAGMPPRPSVQVIVKKGGGVIGT
jgi:secreted PhoX family phosphatase